MSDYVVHEEEYKGLTIKILPDDDPQSSNPMDWDMLGKQVYWHRRMNLGHCYKDTSKYSPMEWLRYECYDFAEDSKQYNDWKNHKDGFIEGIEFVQDLDVDDWLESNASLSDLLELFSTKNLVIPVSAYEHGGITISASGRRAGWDSFDSGQLGFVYVSHKDIIKEYGSLDLERAEKTLIAEVSTYDDYLTGQVYGYVIEDENGEQLDRVGGFLGDYKYCLDEAKSSADYYAKKAEEELDLYDKRMTE